jgi:hypothetical protein
MQANKQAVPYLRKQTRESFRTIGDVVKQEQARRLGPVSFKSAAGYRTRVLQRGVVVAQSLRKTTGKRPDYGAFQMRLLLRTVRDNEAEIMRRTEAALDDVSRHWERVP